MDSPSTLERGYHISSYWRYLTKINMYSFFCFPHAVIGNCYNLDAHLEVSFEQPTHNDLHK